MSNAMLNTRVLQPLPLIEISSQDLKDLSFFIKSGIDFTQIILPFPCGILFTVVIPHHFVELDDLAPGHFPLLSKLVLVFPHRSNPIGA